MATYPSLPIAYCHEVPPDYRAISTAFEMGYEQTRAKTTVAPREYEIGHHALTGAEVSTWLTFWNQQSGEGAVFNFTDPRTSSVVVCRFKTGAKPKAQSQGSTQVYHLDGIVLREAL